MGDSKTGDFARRSLEVIGATAGGAAGLVTGDPSVGFVSATFGTLVGGLVGDMAARRISTVEKRRLNTVAGEATRLIKHNLDEGRAVRNDGFFDEDETGRSRAHEVVEAALFAAMGSYEEKKIPHIAHLLAEAAFVSEVDGATLNWALARAQTLTWTQYLLLAAVASDDYSLPKGGIGRGGSWFGGSWDVWGAHQQFAELESGTNRFLASSTEQLGTKPLLVFDRTVVSQRVSNSGALLYALLGLELIEPREVQGVLDALERPHRSAE